MAGGITNWTVFSGIFPENTVSLALHAEAGFRVVGTLAVLLPQFAALAEEDSARQAVAGLGDVELLVP